MSARKNPKCKLCRKSALPGTSFCASHTKAEAAPAEPPASDSVVKVTELEATRFAQLDAETRNTMQGIKILELEFETAERNIQVTVQKHQADQLRRQSEKKHLDSVLVQQKAGYIEFIKTLADKYKIDPSHMAIDPESRTLRDLSEKSKA